MKWQLTLQIGINDCPGDKGIDRDCQCEGGREREREEEGEVGLKGGGQEEKHAGNGGR